MEENRNTDSGDGYHVPVLFNETLDLLNIDPSGIYVDCTMGGGGHARGILQRLGPGGKLVLFDQDEDAVANVPEDNRVLFIPHNFRHLHRFLKLHKLIPVNGILADLGVSSHQFNEASRGFSTRFDADLDMRMDVKQDRTAAYVLNSYDEASLQKMFSVYGEVTNAKTLAATIVSARAVTPFSTIAQFREAVKHIVKGNPNKYFAQVFQALRIEVNDEMKALEEMLEQAQDVLKPGGRLAVITFHSGEDRIVKNFLKGEKEEDPADLYGSKRSVLFRIITRKPVTASPDELKKNPRSRSAKLRVAEKI